MDDNFIGLVAILSAVTLPIVAGLILGYQFITSRHRERMGLINQGIIPPETSKKKSAPDRLISLRNGIVLVSLGIGIVAGILIIENLVLDKKGESSVMASAILVFLGIGYLAYFFLSQKIEKKDIQEETQQD